MRRVLPPKYDWRLAGLDPYCGIGGRCLQGFGEGDADLSLAVAPASAAAQADADRQMFWRAVGIGVGVTLAVRIIDRLLLSRLF